MSLSVSTSVGYQRDSSAVSASATITAGQEIAMEESIPIAADNLVAFTLDVSQCKAFFMVADQNLTVETNANNAAGGQTITLTANVPFFWQTNSGITCPLTPDITALYVTNASAAVATLKIRCLVDPTV